MKNKNFRELLFKVAFCSMACDGHIDQREIDELKIIDKKASFFESINLSDELTQLLDDFRDKGTKVIEELFVFLRKTKLNPVQELLVLEVALRIINADNIHDENEKRFIHLLRSKLELHDSTINDRFGHLEILHTSDYSQNIVEGKTEIEFANGVTLPDMSDLKQIDLSAELKTDL